MKKVIPQIGVTLNIAVFQLKNMHGNL